MDDLTNLAAERVSAHQRKHLLVSIDCFGSFQVKYSALLGEWLVELGYTHCFFVAGGGIMHLLDGFRSRFQCIAVVHEMAAGVCAEHFNECSKAGNRAFALVTTGPGLTNAITSIAGCYVEHRELLVIAGQVKSTDLLVPPERQRGVQEVDGRSICQSIAVRSERIEAPIGRASFRRLVQASWGPHPGPSVVEVCLDVQGAWVDPKPLIGEEAPPQDLQIRPLQSDISAITHYIDSAVRPLILFGGLVTRRSAQAAIPHLEALGIPVATTTSAIDRVPSSSAVFAGRPGTWGGQRAGNIILAQADMVLAIGAQLDLQQTGFNYLQYAPLAKLIHVFPSVHELQRIGPPAALKVLASPDLVLEKIVAKVQWKDRSGWLRHVQQVRELAPPLETANISAPGYINSFKFFQSLSQATRASDVLALCSSGGTFTGALQMYSIAAGQTATTSAAHASMGYGLPTAIGAAFTDRSKRVVLTEGEGGFSQCLQELAVVRRYELPIKIFLLENGGYASIRATQKKFFNGAYLGCDSETGLGFPDWQCIFKAYDIPCHLLTQNEVSEVDLCNMLAERDGPQAWIVRVDPNQPNWPAVSTSLSQDGSMTSSPLHDMQPPLPAHAHEQIWRVPSSTES